MIKLVPVTVKNYKKIKRLKIRQDQNIYVPSFVKTLAEAFDVINSGGSAFPFFIVKGFKTVGLVLIGYGNKAWENPPPISDGNYDIWRIMVDERYQGRGIGREALLLAIDFIKTLPIKEDTVCWLAVNDNNVAAKNLYLSVGFKDTGICCEDGRIMVFPLKR